jgi:hypothetical protein
MFITVAAASRTIARARGTIVLDLTFVVINSIGKVLDVR